MTFKETHRIIWLDAFIGQDNECYSFKRMFRTTLDPLSRTGDPLDILICALQENGAPFIFIDTRERAIEEIELHHDKQIIFISSGSLGQQIIPIISSRYQNYVDFAYGYLSCLQMFNSELDLLVRLVRDLSKEILDQGRNFLTLNDPYVALEYFKRSAALEKTANEKDTLNGSFLDHLRLLNGYGDRIGLVQEAQNQINERQRERERHAGLQEPIITEHDSPMAQEDIANENPDSPIGQEEA